MMKERFYPRDIGMWRKMFDFSSEIGSHKPKFLEFNDRKELIEFLKDNGVRLDDPKHPLMFLHEEHFEWGNRLAVVQWSVLGWISTK